MWIAATLIDNFPEITYRFRIKISDQRQIAMKLIPLFMILVYILLPVVCFAHPIELHVEVSSDVFDVFTSEHPDKQGMDNCKSACCCAEYTFSTSRNIGSLAAMRFRGQSLCLKLPQIFTPIFVPPA